MQKGGGGGGGHWKTERQCLKFTLIILRGGGGEIDTRGPPKYTPGSLIHVVVVFKWRGRGPKTGSS